jgi:hypothetical protein
MNGPNALTWGLLARVRNALLQIAPDSGQLQSFDIAKGVSKWAIANV